MLERDHGGMIPRIGSRYAASHAAASDAARLYGRNLHVSIVGVTIVSILFVLIAFAGLHGIGMGLSDGTTPALIGGLALLAIGVAFGLTLWIRPSRLSSRQSAVHAVLADQRVVGLNPAALGVEPVYRPDRSDDEGVDQFPLQLMLWRADMPPMRARLYAYVPREDWMAMTGMPVPMTFVAPDRLTMIMVDVELAGTVMTVIAVQPIAIDAVADAFWHNGNFRIPEDMLVGRNGGADSMAVGFRVP